MRRGSIIALAFALIAARQVAAQRGPNPEFAFSIGGPCGETIYGFAGSTYDDGTGGTDLLFDTEACYGDLDGDGVQERLSRSPSSSCAGTILGARRSRR
jgi:outer membrane lipoprotein SlyB